MSSTQSLHPHSKAADLLGEILAEKSRKNPSYSQRAVARDLGLSHGFLSLLLSGKKSLTFKRALQICQVLRVGEQQSQVFLRTVALESTKDATCRAYLEEALRTSESSPQQEFATLELDRFRALSEWYHIAILDLTLIRGFKPDFDWIGAQLGISARQVRVAVERLERLGLLEINGTEWKKTSAKLAIPTTYSDQAVKVFHDQMIDKAKEAMHSPNPDDFEKRDITGTTLAIDPRLLPEAKKRIQKFRRELLEFFETGEPDELYQLNVQLFRLTKHEMNNPRKPGGK
jgi:uncharacterized protein (TIGR02147 family)